MEDLKNFIAKLEATLEKKEEEFNKKLLPEVQKNYNLQGTAIQAIKSILLKKSLIIDDPYKYDEKMTDIECPESSPFSDSEKAAKVGERLAKYEIMIDFLNSYYQFNTEFLTPKKISKLLNLNQCFLWSDFTSTSNNLNTKGLADIIQGVYSGEDKLSAGLLRDSLSHLNKTNKEINKQLKELSHLKKEKYKLFVRKLIFGKVCISEEDLTNPARVLKETRKLISEKNKKTPYYSDLIIEIIKEDYSPDSNLKHEAVLKNLSSNEKINKTITQEKNYRPILLDGLKILGNSAPHFNEALEKIKYNDEIIFKQDLSGFHKFIQALKKAFNISPKKKEITITIENSATQTKTREKIDYNAFINDMSKKNILYSNIISPNSPVQQKMKQLSNDVLLDNLSKYISESNILIKQMKGLDEFYKTFKPELRGKIKGIKIEITTITNSLIKANQCRAEYIDCVEEELQMKKLGIK